MNSIVKIYGIIIVATIVIFFTGSYQRKIAVSNDLVQTVKTTQTSVINDSLNLGDIRLGKQISVSKDKVMKKWLERFEENRDLNVHYVIEMVDINEAPPAIAVRVKGYSDNSVEDDKLIYDYSNIVIIDK